MPRFAHVKTQVRCPGCGADLAPDGAIGFQWGYCSNPLGGAYFTYEVGNPLLWRQDRSGSVPAWVYFRESGLNFGGDANSGDPVFSDLLVRESEYEIRSCAACGQAFDGIAVRIDQGLIAEVVIYENPGSLPDCDVATLDPNGSYRARPEWDNHPMASGIDGGRLCRLIEMPKLLRSEAPR